MGVLTGTSHGDEANDLFLFYQEASKDLATSGQYYMAAVALALAAEAVLLAYMLVEFQDQREGDLQVPDQIGFAQLIEAAREVGVLSAPIDIPSHLGGDDPPAHMATDVVDKIRQFRNLIHPGKALRAGFDPRTFVEADYQLYSSMYESICHSLLYNL